MRVQGQLLASFLVESRMFTRSYEDGMEGYTYLEEPEH